MNIFGNGNIVNICAKRGGKTTIIVNGQVFDGTDALAYTRFDKKIVVNEEVNDIFMQANSEDIILKKGNNLSARYTGSYAGEKEPEISYNVSGNKVTINVKSAEFMQNSRIEVSIPSGINKGVFKTASGDVSCTEEIGIDNIEFGSMSGDIESNFGTKNISLSTVSGDIEAIIETDFANITSTSGDIDLAIVKSKNVSISNVSGDIDAVVNEDCMVANLSSVSGKVKDRCKKVSTGTVISANTVSGNIYLD